MNKLLKDYTNAQLLEELGQRIVFGRLKSEGFEFDGLIQIKCPNYHPVNIWDNEWKDTTKPDYTGARTNLNFWMVEAQQKKDQSLPGPKRKEVIEEYLTNLKKEKWVMIPNRTNGNCQHPELGNITCGKYKKSFLLAPTGGNSIKVPVGYAQRSELWVCNEHLANYDYSFTQLEEKGGQNV